ncbi:MAG: hypothetical protein GXP40_05740 [Chloroflexi bacterium]|nr:hypothetical protein [Chloroflexota bacterium]
MKLRKIAAVLMLISGVTHVSQLFVYGAEVSVVGASVFGLIYFVIGLFLLGKRRGALWAGAILPTIGGILGVYRFIFLHTNPFTVFHVLIDLVVIPICVYLLQKKD